MLHHPARLFRLLAIAEAVTWMLLLTGMFLKYVTGTTELGVRVGGGVHGLVFLAYCTVTVLVAVDHRWSAARTAAGLAAAIVPFATVPFERAVLRHGHLQGPWRLLQVAPATWTERLVGVALRRPVSSGLVVAAALVVVFSGLLMLGPPTQWAA